MLGQALGRRASVVPLPVGTLFDPFFRQAFWGWGGKLVSLIDLPEGRDLNLHSLIPRAAFLAITEAKVTLTWPKWQLGGRGGVGGAEPWSRRPQLVAEEVRSTGQVVIIFVCFSWCHHHYHRRDWSLPIRGFGDKVVAFWILFFIFLKDVYRTLRVSSDNSEIGRCSRSGCVLSV